MFHKHKWKVLTCTEVSVYKLVVVGEPDRYDMEFTILCTVCGKITKHRLRGYKLDSEHAAEYALAQGWEVSHLTE